MFSILTRSLKLFGVKQEMNHDCCWNLTWLRRGDALVLFTSCFISFSDFLPRSLTLLEVTVTVDRMKITVTSRKLVDAGNIWDNVVKVPQLNELWNKVFQHFNVEFWDIIYLIGGSQSCCVSDWIPPALSDVTTRACWRSEVNHGPGLKDHGGFTRTALFSVFNLHLLFLWLAACFRFLQLFQRKIQRLKKKPSPSLKWCNIQCAGFLFVYRHFVCLTSCSSYLRCFVLIRSFSFFLN